ncbi:hypothetical protein HNY73_004552 [Argiope bruennichi]|uniref:Uncharacterized protein n=1 Tax=Argiope bruennichi TaxID=94029 RepID=A0A8T0FW75_ARGBR|nr:hypothetical protein HNY73_004552 [Argiope bruennichi]
MAHLDDQNGRPVQPKFLDLSILKPQTKEEVQNALYKIPEMKLRPEKIPDEENVVNLKSWKKPHKDFPYLNPIPASMIHVDISELSKVDIDWKMLTLDRPETPLEIHIFTRIVFLNKVTLKCIVQEKARKERLQSIRLRMSGRVKIVQESDNEKIEELTYEHFSRHFGAGDRGQAMEEVPKPPPVKESKVPQLGDDMQSKTAANPKEETISSIFRSRKRKLKGRKKKISKKRKKGKKRKIRKRKVKQSKSSIAGNKSGKKSISSKSPKSKKTLPLKKKSSNVIKISTRKPGSGRTLIQMLKSSEKRSLKLAKEKLKDEMSAKKS